MNFIKRYAFIVLLLILCSPFKLYSFTKVTGSGLVIIDKNLPKSQRYTIPNLIKKMDQMACSFFSHNNKKLLPCTIRFNDTQKVPLLLKENEGRYLITLPTNFPGRTITPYEKLMRLLLVRASRTPLTIKRAKKIPYWIIIGILDEIQNTHFKQGLFATLYLPGLRINAITKQFPNLKRFLEYPIRHTQGIGAHNYYREVSFFLFKSLPVKKEAFRRYILLSLAQTKQQTKSAIFIKAFNTMFHKPKKIKQSKSKGKRQKEPQLITMENFQSWFNNKITKELINQQYPLPAAQIERVFNKLQRIEFTPKNSDKKKKNSITAFCSLEEFAEYYDRMEHSEKIKKQLIYKLIILINHSSPLLCAPLTRIVTLLKQLPKGSQNYKKDVKKWVKATKEANKRLKNIELYLVRIEKCNTPPKVYFTNSFYELDYQNKLDKERLIKINQYLDKIEKEY